jgi:hypothetical protein
MEREICLITVDNGDIIALTKHDVQLAKRAIKFYMAAKIQRPEDIRKWENGRRVFNKLPGQRIPRKLREARQPGGAPLPE